MQQSLSNPFSSFKQSTSVTAAQARLPALSDDLAHSPAQSDSATLSPKLENLLNSALDVGLHGDGHTDPHATQAINTVISLLESRKDPALTGKVLDLYAQRLSDKTVQVEINGSKLEFLQIGRLIKSIDSINADVDTATNERVAGSLNKRALDLTNDRRAIAFREDCIKVRNSQLTVPRQLLETSLTLDYGSPFENDYMKTVTVLGRDIKNARHLKKSAETRCEQTGLAAQADTLEKIKPCLDKFALIGQCERILALADEGTEWMSEDCHAHKPCALAIKQDSALDEGASYSGKLPPEYVNVKMACLSDKINRANELMNQYVGELAARAPGVIASLGTQSDQIKPETITLGTSFHACPINLGVAVAPVGGRVG